MVLQAHCCSKLETHYQWRISCFLWFGICQSVWQKWRQQSICVLHLCISCYFSTYVLTFSEPGRLSINMFLPPNGNISEVIRFFFYINNKIELIVNHSYQSAINSCANICWSHLAVYNMNENILDNLLKHVLDLRWDIQAMVLITFTKFLTMVFLSNILKNNCDLIMSRYLPSPTLVEERLRLHRCLSTGVTCTSLTDTHHQADTHPLGRHPSPDMVNERAVHILLECILVLYVPTWMCVAI